MSRQAWNLFRNKIAPIALLAALSFPAHATTLNWKTATSGLASSGGNWTPSGVPTSTDDTVFNLVGSYTVTWTGVANTQSQTYKKGNVSFFSSGPHTIGSLFRIGDVSGDAATLTITGGTMNANAAFSVGNASGSTGSLNVSGPSAQIVTPGTSDMTVGPGGTGTVSIGSGGRVSIANFSVLGSQASGNGTLIVAGLGPASTRSQFTTGNPSPGTFSIGVLGKGSFRVDNGALATATNKVAIASGTGSVGDVSVGGVSGAFASEFQVTGALDIAFASGAPAAGTGSLRVYNGGKTTVSGLTTVGDANGGTGTLRVESKSRFTSGGLVFDDTNGKLEFPGGTIEVLGGTFNPPGSTLDLASGDTLILDSDAFASFGNTPYNAYALIVGETGKSEVHVLGGSTMSTTATTAVGLNPGSVGVLRVEGGSTWSGSSVSQMVLGLAGSGNLSVAGGGQLQSDIFTAGYLAGSSAFIDVTGAGSRIDGSSITFGGSGTTPGGNTYVIVTNGGVIESNADQFGIRILSPATVNVDAGGSLITPFCEIDNRGRVNLGGGTVSAVAGFHLGSTGSLHGNGTVRGPFIAPDTTSVVHASGGTLELGDSTLVDGFQLAGRLEVGSAGVRVRSKNQTPLQRCSMTGGLLTVRPGGANIPAGRNLLGYGTLDTRLVNFGALIAQNASGLTFLDTLVISTGTMSGTKFTFAPGSLYSGTGVINSDAVVAQAGSTIQTSSLTIGKNAATTSVTLQGRLLLSQNSQVTVNHLVSTAPCDLGTRTVLEQGARVIRANGFSLSAGDTLVGRGTVQGSLTNGGVATPGTEGPASTPLSTLNVSGTYTQSAGGRLIVEIGDAPTLQFDRLAIMGAATLGGTLDVRLPPGFAPSPGEAFTVMTFTSRTGTFSNVTFQGHPPGTAITVTYNATSVVVTAGTIPVGVDPPALPAALAFSGASGERAAFTIALPEAARVRIALYSASGRMIGTLCDRDLPAGVMRFPVERGPGVWFARASVITAQGSETRTARVTSLR